MELRTVSDPELGRIVERLHADDDPAILAPLISPDLLASDFAFGPTVNWLVDKSTRSDAFRVIPVLVRPAVWERSGFAPLQVLPRNARPITEWESRSSAEASVAVGCGRAGQPHPQATGPGRAPRRGPCSAHRARAGEGLRA